MKTNSNKQILQSVICLYLQHSVFSDTGDRIILPSYLKFQGTPDSRLQQQGLATFHCVCFGYHHPITITFLINNVVNN